MAEPIKINFLGTGSAVPTKRRNHPAVLLKYKDENLLFDCGEGTQKQFRIAELNPCRITRIFISHWHGDHVFGLPGLLQTLMLNNYSGVLQIYGPRGTKRTMELYKNLFIGKQDSLKIEVKEITSGIIVDSKEFKIEAQEMQHDAPCLAYSFTIKEKNRIDKAKLKKLKLPENTPLIGELVKGKTIEFEGKKIDGKKLIYKEDSRKFTYIIDTSFNKDAVDFAKESDILICESTYASEEAEEAREYSHMTSTQAAEIAKKSKSKKLFLMHLSQRYENPKQILDEAKKVFKETKVAEDFDKLEI
ncbi:ribonuclease Z [Candidatus Pacearchaeota archaeon]|nr:ribonuclease Z [Candidatus Pacearchaeota archaeon]